MKKQKLKSGTVVVDMGKGFADLEKTRCCGIYEFNGIDRPPQNLVTQVYEELGGDKYNIFIFHDVTCRGNGKRLCDFIKRHKLGKVTATASVNNPNTGRNITLWSWVVGWASLHKFMETKVIVKGHNGDYRKPEIETKIFDGKGYC